MIRLSVAALPDDRIRFAFFEALPPTKRVVASLVRGIAIDLAPRGITVNNVQPGPTETDMTAAHAETVKPRVPLGRLGKPEEIVGLAAYLASPESEFNCRL